MDRMHSWNSPRKRRRIVAVVLALTLVLFVTASCEQPIVGRPASQQEQRTAFSVPPGEKNAIAVGLRAGDTFEGSFSVSGRDNFIDFYVRAPDGSLAFGVMRAVGSQSFQVIAKQSGSYSMFFDNAFSFGSPRQVILSYAVR